MKTIAQMVADSVNNAPNDYDDSQCRLILTDVDWQKENIVAMRFPYGEDSYDPTIIFTYSDNSELRVANMKQVAFRLNVTVLKGEW